MGGGAGGLAVPVGGVDSVADSMSDVLDPLQAMNSLIGQLEAQAELARTQIEPLRLALADALYKNLAQLMLDLGANEDVAAFFYLELLRQTEAEEEEIVPVPTP